LGDFNFFDFLVDSGAERRSSGSASLSFLESEEVRFPSAITSCSFLLLDRGASAREDINVVESLASARNCSARSLRPGWTFFDRVVTFVRGEPIDSMFLDKTVAVTKFQKF
jgi:hypothetical protein